MRPALPLLAALLLAEPLVPLQLLGGLAILVAAILLSRASLTEEDAVAAAVGVVSPVSSAGKSLMRCKPRWSAVCASERAMARPSDCAVVLR